MTKQNKAAIALGVLVTSAVVVLLLVVQSRGGDQPAPVATGSPEESMLVREDSRILGEEGSSGVTFVEFLDFECEACAAAYPAVEQLRQEYAGEVTFVARYFPLPGHFNAERAARAVESAARQGELEAMYQRMYETQAEWGEAQVPHDDLFRGFAEEIGLDMQQYDADYASDEVAARVQRDVDDGLELGVQGTPTFYVDGEPLQPRTYEDFTSAIDAALASS
ncbi:thioredoxin domain-containing protein [Aeromicrobium sp. REDSEA-S32_B7]|uniref:DsbA family protein n=1 Tax=Aeromicrobium sp. REDSEA-S32_B7 TaxID=1811526 RepID=UPI000B1F7FBA|nr:thioredoxin domain-containing protein [Aeromicrobium sp. REDSEA-S32_B7]MAY96541.1 thioredoxin [Nocardioides sp.]|tara:strand:+ start:4233 stop:4898 length:666 start_codon:yes stop_codon:yes gene_type:complete